VHHVVVSSFSVATGGDGTLTIDPAYGVGKDCSRELPDGSVKDPCVQVCALAKSFAGTPVLRGVDFELLPGDFLTVLGPNGSGKTTLIRLIAGLARPTAGSVFISGISPSDDSVELRARIGVILHQALLYNDLTVEENLRFYGRMYSVPDVRARACKVMDLLAISRHAGERVGTLSRGLQQRASIARAILHEPSILLIDEPDSGLDQRGMSILKQLLGSLKSEGRTTILMATHNLEMGFELCSEVAILVNGQLAFKGKKVTGNLAALKRVYRHFTGEEG
jgi:ABC-type multidrug transport system ATPase subunit